MGSSISKPMGSTKRQRPDDNAQAARGRKKAHIEPCDSPPVEDKMITVVVGETEFQESLDFLHANSGYIKSLYHMNPALDFVQFHSDPNHWELVKSVLKPFSKITVNQNNYAVLLPWFVALQCTEGLLAADNVIKNMILGPLLTKKQSDRSKEDVTHIVTVLGHCLDNHRADPAASCIRFLVQMLDDPNQPFKGEDILCILRLIAKIEAFQQTLWGTVRRYLPGALAEKPSFPEDLINVLTDNHLLAVVEANMNLKYSIYGPPELDRELRQDPATQGEHPEPDLDGEVRQDIAIQSEHQEPQVFCLRPLLDWEKARLKLDMDVHIDEHNAEAVVARLGESGNTLMRRSLFTLKPAIWLNDEVINFYMGFLNLQEEFRVQGSTHPRSYCMNSSFMTQLNQEGHANEGTCRYLNVKRRYKSIPGGNIFKLDKIMVPINIRNKRHWTCAQINIKAKTITYHDSLGGRGHEYKNHLLQYIKGEYERLLGIEMPEEKAKEWDLEKDPIIPQQLNNFDCGVFVCVIIDCILLGQPLTFNQHQLEGIRDHLALALLTVGEARLPAHWLSATQDAPQDQQHPQME
jgi:sentrin-specific protease 1